LRLFVREHFTSTTMERNMWNEPIRAGEGTYGL
jgi:hypothetical protein